MYDSYDEYDSDEEPESLSEEEMPFLSEHQQDTALGVTTKRSIWGVIDKTRLAHVQVRQCTFLLKLSHLCEVCDELMCECRMNRWKLCKGSLAVPET